MNKELVIGQGSPSTGVRKLGEPVKTKSEASLQPLEEKHSSSSANNNLLFVITHDKNLVEDLRERLREEHVPNANEKIIHVKSATDLGAAVGDALDKERTHEDPISNMGIVAIDNPSEILQVIQNQLKRIVPATVGVVDKIYLGGDTEGFKKTKLVTRDADELRALQEKALIPAPKPIADFRLQSLLLRIGEILKLGDEAKPKEQKPKPNITTFVKKKRSQLSKLFGHYAAAVEAIVTSGRTEENIVKFNQSMGNLSTEKRIRVLTDRDRLDRLKSSDFGPIIYQTERNPEQLTPFLQKVFNLSLSI